MDASAEPEWDPRKIKNIWEEYLLIEWKGVASVKFETQLKQKYDAEAEKFVAKHREGAGAWDKILEAKTENRTTSPEWFQMLRKRNERLIAAMEFNLRYNKEADKLVAENAKAKGKK
jgi:hypothetical protein